MHLCFQSAIADALREPLLGAEAGFDSFFWGRMDWQDRQMRFNKEQGTDGFEWIWQGSQSLGSSAQIFAGNLYGTGSGGYGVFVSTTSEDSGGEHGARAAAGGGACHQQTARRQGPTAV